MLRRRVGSVVTVAVLMVMGLYNTPLAEASPTLGAGCTDNSRNTKECKLVVSEPGGSGSGGSGSGGSETGGSGGEPRVCKANNGFVVPCEKDGYTWMDSNLQYCKVLDLQPSKSDPVWAGNTTGAIWSCAFNEMSTFSTLVWFPSADPVQPDPEVLAKQAVAQLGLQAIELGIAPRTLEADPDSLGSVGVPNWMWVANPGPQTTEPQSRTVSENGWTVAISSKLRQVVWDMGDGGPEVFCGVGVPYYVEYGIKEAPSCGHRYEKQGVYTVKATSQWDVTWSGLGRSGVIPLEFTTTGTVKIGEIQTVIIKTKP